MIKYIRLILLAILCLPVYSFAQQAKCTVSGRIIDDQKSPVAYASVAVYKDNSPLTGTITDNEGKFTLKVAQSVDSYQLVVEFIGYSKVRQEIVPDKSQLNLGAIVLKEDAISLEGAEISNKGVTNNSNVLFDFLPWKGGDIQCQYFVSTPQYFPQLTTSLTHQMNVGFKQRFLKGAMTASILLTDVFKTAKWEVSSHNNIFDLTNISRNKSRMLWLGFSYNFNSFKQKADQKTESDRSLIRLGL